MISLAWMVGAIISLLPTTHALSTMEYIHAIRHCTIKTKGKRVQILFGLLSFFIYPLTMIICYSVIAYSLGKQKKKLQQSSHGRKHSYAVSKMDIPMGQPSTYSATVWRSEFLSDSKEKQFNEEVDTRGGSGAGTDLKEEKTTNVTVTVPGSSSGVDDHSAYHDTTHKNSGVHNDNDSEQNSSLSPKAQDHGTPKVKEKDKQITKKKVVQPDASTCSEHTNCDMIHTKLAVQCHARKEKKHYDAQKRVTVIGKFLKCAISIFDQSINQSINQSIYQSINQSRYHQSIYLSIYLSVCLSIFLSIYLSKCM